MRLAFGAVLAGIGSALSVVIVYLQILYAFEKAAWIKPQWSQSYITLQGPANKRVFVNTNMSSSVTQNWSKLNPGPTGANYVEQIQWRDAASGRLLAASDFLFPAALAATVPVGYGGLIYDLLNNGHIMALQVLPRTTSSNSTTTKSAPGGSSG